MDQDHPVRDIWRGGHAIRPGGGRPENGEKGWIGVSADSNYYCTRWSLQMLSLYLSLPLPLSLPDEESEGREREREEEEREG